MFANQVERLKDKADFLITDPGPLIHIDVLDGYAIQAIGAAAWRVQQAENRQ